VKPAHPGIIEIDPITVQKQQLILLLIDTNLSKTIIGSKLNTKENYYHQQIKHYLRKFITGNFFLVLRGK
jgi:aspartate ammonia-lyase